MAEEYCITKQDKERVVFVIGILLVLVLGVVELVVFTEPFAMESAAAYLGLKDVDTGAMGAIVTLIWLVGIFTSAYGGVSFNRFRKGVSSSGGIVAACSILTIAVLGFGVVLVIGGFRDSKQLQVEHYQNVLAQENTILKGQGLLGERRLGNLQSRISTEMLGSLKGSMSAAFFLVVGSAGGEIEGQFASKDMEYILFYWEAANGEWVKTYLPYNLVNFKPVTDYGDPTVNFNIRPEMFMTSDLRNRWKRWVPLSYPTPQKYIESGKLEKVVITLSLEEFSKVPLLSKRL